MSEPIRVLVCEPNPIARHGLLVALREADDIAVVAQVSDEEGGMRVAGDVQVDVAIVDPDHVEERLPGLLGGVGVKVLLITTGVGDDETAAAARLGIRGLLVRDDLVPDELPAIVRLLHAGRCVTSVEPWRRLGENVWRLQRRVTELDGIPYGMTPRENDVYRYLERGLSNAQIAELLSISPNTVRTHVTHVFEKTGITSRIDLIRKESVNGTRRKETTSGDQRSRPTLRTVQ